MPLIDNLNELIDFSMSFPFYQRLNPLFNWISAPFINWSKHLLRSRGLGPAGPGGPARAQKCFDQLIKGRGKGQIH